VFSPRLDQFWINANRNSIFYEFDRRDGTLSYCVNGLAMDRYFGLMTGRRPALFRVGRNVLHSRFLACFPKIFYCAWTRTTLVPRSR